MRLFLISFLFIPLSFLGQDFENLVFGNDSTLDVVTWNIEWFPKNGTTTVNYVVDIVEALDADVIAFQEIDENWYFEDVIEMLDGYDGFVVEDEYSGLAYLYKNDVIELNNMYEIFPAYNNEFPREPLVMKFTFMEEEYTIINNHLKCCGDGNLDISNDWDEETRRLEACLLLDNHIDFFHSDENVIVLGDFNDILVENNPLNNVFENFLIDTDNYLFVDFELAEATSYYWSYPSWPSHLDHILITSELFDEMEGELSYVETIRVDDFFNGGFNQYDNYVSDHRPVGIRLQPENIIIHVEENIEDNAGFSLFPNPNNGEFRINWNYAKGFDIANVFNSQGQLIKKITLGIASKETTIDMSDQPSGIYTMVLSSETYSLSSQFIIED